MAGTHKFSGSFSHSGSTPAQFISGIKSENIITGNFVGDGSLLINLTFETSATKLFFGSESIGTPNTYGNWITGSGNNHTILLSTSASNGAFNHFTFLKLDTTDGWLEVSNYAGTLNGLRSNTTLEQTLATGIHEYLLLAMSTASKETVTTGATVIINPDEL